MIKSYSKCDWTALQNWAEGHCINGTCCNHDFFCTTLRGHSLNILKYLLKCCYSYNIINNIDASIPRWKFSLLGNAFIKNVIALKCGDAMEMESQGTLRVYRRKTLHPKEVILKTVKSRWNRPRREAVLERDVTKCSSCGIGPNRIFHLSLLKPEFLLN